MNPSDWNALIARLPHPHLLQTSQWAEVKARFGWQPFYLTWPFQGQATAAAALVLRRTVTLGGFAPRLRVLYVPKGPLLDWTDAGLRSRILDELAGTARRQGAIFIKIDPDVPTGAGVPGQPGTVDDPMGAAVQAELSARGWRFSEEQIQFRNTVLVDLEAPEAELLSRMKQKTRYNINLAQRKGVTIRVGGEADYPLLYRMYAETATRDGFIIRDQAYYQAVWKTFQDASMAEPLIAEVEGEPAAALVLFHFAGKAWYLYGMSRPVHRERMPNYLLQWEAMRQAKAAGCQVYDLWGAPDEFNENDSMWGVYRFKEGLGGQVQRTIGAWDLPTRPLLYRLYTRTLPRLLDLMRRRGRARVERAAAT